MDKFWIIYLILSTTLLKHETNGQSDVKVQLIVKKYVEKGSSVTLHCQHNIEPHILNKVTWLKNGNHKLFEYINGRNPPFKNHSVAGAEIDLAKSNEKHVTLKNIDFEAAGLYNCEASTDTPIFTKASADEQLHVILPQTGPPQIRFLKDQFYVGENLIANCSTSKARPAPHITWLINGKKVDDIYTRTLHPHSSSPSSGGKNSHRPKTHKQQTMQYYDRNAVNDVNSKGLMSGGKESGDPNGNLENQYHQPQYHPQHSQQQQQQHHHHHQQLSPAAAGVGGGGGGQSGGGGVYNIYDNNFEVEQNVERNHNNRNTYNNNNNVKNKEFNTDYHDNKYFDIPRKHRNSYNRKHRRYAREGGGAGGANGGAGGLMTNTAGGGGVVGTGGGGGREGGGSGNRILTRPVVSSSELSIEVSELHDINGKIEITCLATIPAHVGPGEQFADYKTHSIKINIETAEQTSPLPPLSNMAALGNKANHIEKLNNPKLIILCFVTLFTVTITNCFY